MSFKGIKVSCFEHLEKKEKHYLIRAYYVVGAKKTPSPTTNACRWPKEGMTRMKSEIINYIPSDMSCLLSHKCKCEYHTFAQFICPIFEVHSVKLLIDPFGPGVDVCARIQALEFQALLFLFSPESWNSWYCQTELAAAQAAWVPVFSIRWSGDLPQSLSNRVFVDHAGHSNADIEEELHCLAQAVRIRGSIRKLIERLHFPNTPEEVRDAAERLADESDCTALTEFLDCLDQTYSKEIDPIARGNLAFAVGKTGTDKAKRMLLAWRSSSDHPYPQKCISQSLDWVRNKKPDNKGENK